MSTVLSAHLARSIFPAAICIAFCTQLHPATAAARLGAPVLDPAFSRIIFLGDSITDGNTYPSLVRQAIIEAGYKPEPVAINAGVGGNTAAEMLARVDSDVLAYHPTLVTILAGANDTFHGVSPDSYAATIKAILDKIKPSGARVILLTPCILGPARAGGRALLSAYTEQLRQIAKENGLAVGEVTKVMQEEADAGQKLLSPDDLHPNYEGQRCIARAILDAMGLADVPVPAKCEPKLFPGLVKAWKFRPAAGLTLDDAGVVALKPDKTWITVTLPDKTPVDADWLDDNRREGFQTSMDKVVGPGSLVGITTLNASHPRTVYLNTGGGISKMWLNGKLVFTAAAPWPGWHAGKERIPVELVRGVNTVVITEQGPFFLSVTDDNQWGMS